MFKVETIPNNHDLYMRIHMQYIRENKLQPGAFQNHGEGMSTDWSKYAQPIDTKNRARNPDANGVISLNVGATREIPDQTVIHTPEDNNRSHTDVYGMKKIQRLGLPSYGFLSGKYIFLK